MYKEFFGAIATILTFALFFPYIRSIHRGELKPHVFSWVIWGSGTLVVSFAQLAGRGGLGAWVIFISGLITMYIALLAYMKRSDIVVASIDWVFLALVICALPSWFFTSNPLWAVVILTLVDILGFGPTLRKAYTQPYSESVSFFALAVVRNALVILALEHYSLTTVLFPATTGAACLLLTLVLTSRRRSLRPEELMP